MKTVTITGIPQEGSDRTDDHIARLNSMGPETCMEIYQRNDTAPHSN